MMLLVGTLMLLAFIPLYPKLPLVDVFGTWVYIRLEDIIIALVFGVFAFSLIRERKIPFTSLTVPIVVYWIIGFLSLAVSLVFIGPQLSNYFPHIAILHYLRRIEYMMVFFLAYKSAREAKSLAPFISVLSLTVIAVVLYGIGQKFLGFPAFLTMNEEFAKGVPLRLPPTARIASTFGGHYDLAAFLVFVIPIFSSLAVSSKKILAKLTFFLIALSSYLLLLFTASRISFGVYLVAMTLMLLWHKKSILILPMIVGSFILLSSISGASDRFYKTFRFSDVIVDLSTGRPIGTLDKLEGTKAVLEQQESPATEELPKGTEFIHVPGTSAPKKTVRTVEILTSRDLATGSGELATVSGSFLIQKALVYDISITTRFQGQWPKAIEAFKRNIFLGSGYSTLSIASDGDYLRMLGETGLIGTIGFLGIFLMAFHLYTISRKKLSPQSFGFVTGVYAGVAGLLCNAVLIDVFEASKVAYTLWLVLGITIAIIDKESRIRTSYSRVLFQAFTNARSYMLYLAIATWIIWGSIVGGYFLGDDFTWLRWASTSTIESIGKYFTDSQGFFYRPIPKLWYFLMYSVFWLKPAAYFVMSLLLYSGIGVSLFLIGTSVGFSWYVAIIGSFLYSVMSIHHENVMWISGQSSLLSAVSFFYSLYLLIKTKHMVSTWKQSILLVCSFMLLAIAMLSYDSSVVLPIVYWCVGVVLIGYRWYMMAPLLLLIPLYWWIRTLVHAVPLEGDYGINMSKFLVNVCGNGLGYVLSMVIGPQVIEKFQALRDGLRLYSKYLTIVAIIGIGAGGYVLVRISRSLKSYKTAILLFFGGCIAMIPYLGLGNMSERYMMIPSGLFILMYMSCMQIALESKRRTVMVLFCFVIPVAIGFWNIRETKRIERDWQRAYEISRNTVLSIRKEFFPLTNPTTFVFQDPPIRYGRAWIFPVGLPDAIWHLFRYDPHETLVVSSFDSITNRKSLGAQYEFIFENYVLKRRIREIKEVSEE